MVVATVSKRVNIMTMESNRQNLAVVHCSFYCTQSKPHTLMWCLVLRFHRTSWPNNFYSAQKWRMRAAKVHMRVSSVKQCFTNFPSL